MADQMRSFVSRVVTNVNVYQLIALSLALGAVITGMAGGGSGGTG